MPTATKPTELPTLYHKGKKGAIYSWRVWTEEDHIKTEYGLVDGAKQVSDKVATPKNMGRSNATSGVQQAALESKALHTFKLERKYSLTPEKAQEPLFLPMLAKDFEDRKKKIVYPVHVQPKLDGVRALAIKDENGKVQLTSRSGKPWNVPHIAEQLDKILPPGIMLDGEIYIHMEGFQAISKLVKKWRSGDDGDSSRLEYHVYDVVDLNEEEAIWEDRRIALDSMKQMIGGLNAQKIFVVQTDLAENEKDVITFHNAFVKEGYEGAIVRLPHGLYLSGYRSYELLKVKEFDDGEFEIVGFKNGIGKFSDCVIWKCKAPDGEFDVVPKGSLEEKRQWLNDAVDYVGSLLKVKYFGWTDEKLPRFPVGLGIRDEKDI